MNKKLFSQTTLWLVIFGLLNLFASGHWTLSLATWMAPVFALRYLYVHPQRRKFIFFFLVYWITLSIPWQGATLDMVPGTHVDHYIFMLINALVGTLPYIMDRWLAPNLRRNGRLPFVATFIFPLTVTALEFLTINLNPLGNFGAVGYSQYAIPVLTQVTTITGMLGLAFLVSWFPAVVNWAWDNGFEWARVQAGVIAFAVVLAIVISYGIARLVAAPEIGSLETVTVASFTMAENHMGELNDVREERGLDAYRQETQAVHAQYLAMTKTAIADGAKIILWPEIAIIGIEEDVQATVERGQALAREAGIYLGMPTMTVFPNSDRLAENVMFVAGPDGDTVIEHVKYGGVEGTLKGSGDIQSVDTPYGRLSGIICWDTNFPNIVRQVGEQQADILLSPSKEWEGINPMHAEMAVFRAIENGVSVIRQTDEGLSIVTDGYGRALATGEGLADSGNYILAEVPTSSPTTLYPVIGDVVGVISVAGLVFVAVYALVIGGRRQKEVRQTAVAVS